MDEAKERLTPEKVMRILEKHDTKVNYEEAKNICEFMKLLAKITVNSYLESNRKGP